MKGEKTIMSSTKSNRSKKFALLGALIVSLAGVGVSSAFIFTGASQQITPTPADSAIVLEFGSTADIADITELSPGAPQFRSVEVKKPLKSASVGQIERVKFDYQNGQAGVTIEVATQSWSVAETTAVATLSSTATSSTLTPEFGAEDLLTYYIRVSIAQANYDEYLVSEPTTLGYLQISYDAEVGP